MERWRDGEGYRHCSYFYHAIEKYGWDNFEHFIIFDNLTLDEANEKEKILIALFNTNNPQFGYNLEMGGENKKHSEETKQKISNSLIGKMAGEKNPMYGKISPNAKPVFCLETKEYFPSATSAAKKYGVDNSLISKACLGLRKSAGRHEETGKPLHWQYI